MNVNKRKRMQKKWCEWLLNALQACSQARISFNGLSINHASLLFSWRNKHFNNNWFWPVPSGHTDNPTNLRWIINCNLTYFWTQICIKGQACLYLPASVSINKLYILGFLHEAAAGCLRSNAWIGEAHVPQTWCSSRPRVWQQAMRETTSISRLHVQEEP